MDLYKSYTAVEDDNGIGGDKATSEVIESAETVGNKPDKATTKTTGKPRKSKAVSAKKAKDTKSAAPKADKSEQTLKWHNAPKKAEGTLNSMEVVTCIYENVSMASSCIDIIVPRLKNTALRDTLEAQTEDYRQFMQRAQNIADKAGGDIGNTDGAGKVMARVSLKTKLLFDSSTTHIAEMMILGTTMGIIDMGRLLRKSPELTREIQSLADEVMTFEEDKIEALKFYL